ncbi:MAG: Fic family protein [Nanoarchaeota archaeon]|nr:Fic family protein [Nanoarchaeota archaeon]MBU1444772.1 Fic family protein [Nanoarchaeota archaeon]MBU2406858.1 Fic family protein [Nanoarchaeota archaeon]MBU2420060.1 Fic family protein [Nanoarchaeota archaeon]MBU2474901.1 Fic family protein [Nanoarchaeota archaeon]
MHIEKRKVGKRIKYFLAHSYREGSKVHKFRKYLGQDLKKEKLNERKEIAEKLILEEMHKYNIIKDPLHFELSKEEIEEIKTLEKEIPLKITHLSKQDWKEFSEIFVYNTNAIEGSKLNQKEVKDLLEKDKWPDRSKEDIAEAFGVNEAISYIRTTKEHISLEFIKKIHKIIFKNSEQFAGKLRKKGEDVVVINSKGNIIHEGASPPRIVHLLSELIEWYNNNKTKYPGLVLGAVVHNQFENIHPFRDGNGRVGRILLNNILIKHSLPPINIGVNNRIEYYESLKAYEEGRDLKPTIKLYMKEYKELKKKLK